MPGEERGRWPRKYGSISWRESLPSLTSFELFRFAAGACSPLTLLHRHGLRPNPPRLTPPSCPLRVFHRRSVPSAVLPRVTLASVLTPRPSSPKEAQGSTGSSKSGRGSGADSDLESKSFLSRLLSKCTVKEPTYDEVTIPESGTGARGRRVKLSAVDEMQRCRATNVESVGTPVPSHLSVVFCIDELSGVGIRYSSDEFN